MPTKHEFTKGPFIEVEDTVFSVNRGNFTKDSEFFRELFELPQRRDTPVEGTDVDHPLLVEGVKKNDFVLLLKAMYPQKRVLAILQDVADAITKIQLYEELDLGVEEWLIPAVSSLAQRPAPLTEVEGERLGTRNTVRVFRVRESYTCTGCRRGGSGKGAAPGQTRTEHDFTSRIKSVFHVRANATANASASINVNAIMGGSSGN
ncbi:hypothetical protein EIP86_005023 [Pleurotus ostreatoroseus]|nr:hypothetical protein EIP86_005023 [Pleurotus ostreatoroseus]